MFGLKWFPEVDRNNPKYISIRLRATYMGRNMVMLKMYYILYFVKHPNIIDYLQSFLWFLQKMGVQGYLKHSSVIFPARKTGSCFMGDTRLVDPKAAPNFRRGRSRCILWIPIMGFQGQGEGAVDGGWGKQFSLFSGICFLWWKRSWIVEGCFFFGGEGLEFAVVVCLLLVFFWCVMHPQKTSYLCCIETFFYTTAWSWERRLGSVDYLRNSRPSVIRA